MSLSQGLNNHQLCPLPALIIGNARLFSITRSSFHSINNDPFLCHYLNMFVLHSGSITRKLFLRVLIDFSLCDALYYQLRQPMVLHMLLNFQHAMLKGV